GWALPGDAGHFKDPVTAQGIRDALHYGRLLGEMVAPVLDDPQALDHRLGTWERRRELECLAIYQWTNRYAPGGHMTPLEVEPYRGAESRRALARALRETISRVRDPAELLSLRQQTALAARTIRRGTGGRLAALQDVTREIRDTANELRERR